MFHVLVIEDDKNTRKLFNVLLNKSGYIPLLAEDGEKALEVLSRHHIDLIVTDIMLPNMDGYQLTKELRDSRYNLPILMVTSKQQPQDKRKGFLVGADDYITKPFDEEEFLLRIKALLRRSQIATSHHLQIGEVLLDYNALTISCRSDVQTLPPKEFYLLFQLLSYPNKIFTRIQLMDEIWGMETNSTDSTVNVHINRLRSRCSCYSDFDIVTVRGLGYKAVIKYV